MKLLTNIINKNKINYPLGSDECKKELQEKYKNSINETVFLNDDLYTKIAEYDEIIIDIKILEAKKKYIEQLLQSEIKEYETAFCKGRKITWKKVVKNSVDSKRLKNDYPEIVNSYMKSSEYRVFKIN